jgi:hypothetical protein
MKIVYLFLFLMLFGTSCRHTYYHARFPVLERPERPVLENVSGSEMKKLSDESRKSINKNFNNLLGYIQTLEVAIDTYNVYAKEKNKVFNLNKETGK